MEADARAADFTTGATPWKESGETERASLEAGKPPE